MESPDKLLGYPHSQDQNKASVSNETVGRMVFEGIVTGVVPYKERDIIVKLLLRNGFLGSFYVYGGRGGGKHHKPTLFELGSMMKIMIKEPKKQKGDLMVAAEYQRLWEPKSLRHNVQAFYLVCLYVEILQKFAQEFQLASNSFENTDHDGIFSVVSNALFYMEDALDKKQFQAETHLHLFLVKLLFHLGIMPDTDHCGYCQKDLIELVSVSFVPAEGRFSCPDCISGQNEKGFLLRIKKGFQTLYQDYLSIPGTSFQEGDKLLQYFCQQYNVRPMELKTYSLLFK